MKELKRWHKLGQFLSACIYLTVIPFLIMFLLNFSQPSFTYCNYCMDVLMVSSSVFFILRILLALVIKVAICSWEHEFGKKLSDKRLIQLL